MSLHGHHRDECHCMCHSAGPGVVNHIVACCSQCPWCQGRMKNYHNEDACRLKQREAVRKSAEAMIEEGIVEIPDMDVFLDHWEKARYSESELGELESLFTDLQKTLSTPPEDPVTPEGE